MSFLLSRDIKRYTNDVTIVYMAHVQHEWFASELDKLIRLETVSLTNNILFKSSDVTCLKLQVKLVQN